MPMTLKPEPNRPKDLNDNPLPRLTQSRQLNAEPNRVALCTERDDPMRTKARKETEDP
jgi:hypothetical protein